MGTLSALWGPAEPRYRLAFSLAGLLGSHVIGSWGLRLAGASSHVIGSWGLLRPAGPSWEPRYRQLALASEGLRTTLSAVSLCPCRASWEPRYRQMRLH
jgi:hypothetical protein